MQKLLIFFSLSAFAVPICVRKYDAEKCDAGARFYAWLIPANPNNQVCAKVYPLVGCKSPHVLVDQAIGGNKVCALKEDDSLCTKYPDYYGLIYEDARHYCLNSNRRLF